MIVVEGKKAKTKKVTGGIFLGTVEWTDLIDQAMGSKEYTASIVTFPPGTRNKFHTHDHEQILYILSGKGIVADEKEEKVVTEGDIILIPARENHWHGATQDSWFSHLFVYSAETKSNY
ncbi:MAG: cupin domain-containing protein [Candidatus Methylarchaceae archaeon HK01B]|nr:cupin domain-containing protein [Candidatus Methylarchaceae archaeon HK01B]